jgi:hypothetical protein
VPGEDAAQGVASRVGSARPPQRGTGTPALARIRDTWFSAVFSLITSWVAIARLDLAHTLDQLEQQFAALNCGDFIPTIAAGLQLPG